MASLSHWPESSAVTTDLTLLVSIRELVLPVLIHLASRFSFLLQFFGSPFVSFEGGRKSASYINRFARI